MPRLIPPLALSAAVAMSVVALEPRVSADGHETHAVCHTQIEHDSVRLVRVAYVYLDESSSVRFTHQGSGTHVVTRQPTTPGGFRVSRGGDETHSAENLGAIASDFLRVEFKTDAAALAVASILGTALAQQPGPSATPEAVPRAVSLPPALHRVLRDYERAWREGNGSGLAALFTDDGFAVQSGSPIRRGRAAIAQGLTRPGGALQLTAYAFSVSDTVGYIVGGYRYPQSTGPGGRFVLALRMGPDKRWLIAADLDNSPAPSPQAAPVVPAPAVPAASVPPASAQPDADARMALRIGESVTPPKSTATVTFTEVSDDSRCPTNVACVWAGDAAVTLRVQPAKGAAEVVTLHTGLANGQSATAAGLRLRLERLEPRPMFGKTLDRSAYVATIAVASSAGAR